MTERPETQPPMGSSFAEYHAQVLPESSYLQADDPALVIRSGMVEEVIEVLDAELADLPMEIGDCYFYLDAAAALHGTSVEEVMECDSFDTVQAAIAAGLTASLPIHRPDGREALYASPRDELAVRLLRVVDVMNPKSSQLWVSYAGRPDFGPVLKDALVALWRLAEAHGIQVEAAAYLAVAKVKSRERKPHVIDAGTDLTSSGRDRLEQDPMVAMLFGEAVRNNNPWI